MRNAWSNKISCSYTTPPSLQVFLDQVVRTQVVVTGRFVPICVTIRGRRKRAHQTTCIAATYVRNQHHQFTFSLNELHRNSFRLTIPTRKTFKYSKRRAFRRVPSGGPLIHFAFTNGSSSERERRLGVQTAAAMVNESFTPRVLRLRCRRV